MKSHRHVTAHDRWDVRATVRPYDAAEFEVVAFSPLNQSRR